MKPSQGRNGCFESAITAALAAIKRALLITGDPEFALFEKEVKILWLPQAEIQVSSSKTCPPSLST